MLDVETVGPVRVVHWRDGENRRHSRSVAAWHQLLDELEALDGPLALVVVGEGKFFSNGLDLDWLASAPDASGFMVDVHRLLGRMLVFPAYTVAAVNGHAFAMGAVLSATFDRSVMREDRGYWCVPEVDLGLPFTPGMTAALTAKLPRASAHDAMLTGRRYGATDAVAAGIVHELASQPEVLEHAIAAAASIAAKDRRVVAEHKRQLYGAAAAICCGGPS